MGEVLLGIIAVLDDDWRGYQEWCVLGNVVALP
jgi:hypothetical protein